MSDFLFIDSFIHLLVANSAQVVFGAHPPCYKLVVSAEHNAGKAPPGCIPAVFILKISIRNRVPFFGLEMETHPESWRRTFLERMIVKLEMGGMDPLGSCCSSDPPPLRTPLGSARG